MTSIKELKSEKIKFKCEPSKYVEVTNLLGHKYRENSRYDEAIKEHNEAIAACQRIKNAMMSIKNEAISRRALGECYSEMGKHVEAKAQQDIYLKLSLALNDNVEIQRAYATIGRTFLLWAQDTEEDLRRNRNLLFKAEAAFKKSLELCEKLMSSGKLKSREYADMKSRILLNLGLVYENLSDTDRCRELLSESIELTKSNFLYEDLFHCQISLGSIYEKINLLQEALQLFADALQTANQLKSKAKKCEALLCGGFIELKLENIEKARHFFKKAFLLKSPIEEDKLKAERYLKITSLIREDLQKLTRCPKNEMDKIIQLYDRLGDHYVEIKCYLLAIKNYKMELQLAKQENKASNVIAKIHVSIGQTCSDLANYSEAIQSFIEEYNLHEGNICEQCSSLLKIAELQENMYDTTDCVELDERNDLKAKIITTYNQALALFDFQSPLADGQSEIRRNREVKQHINLIKRYLAFLSVHKLELDRQNDLKSKLSQLGGASDDLEIDDDDSQDYADDDPYKSYSLDQLSSDSGNTDGDDEEIGDNLRPRQKRNPNAYKLNRVNQFGETPLHTACIAGNILQVERLIEQKAPLNAKDYCGWTPLHEACNHGHVEIVECLLKNGANIEVCDERSEMLTPLHDACNCGHLNIVRLLLKHGANVLAVDSNNKTPVECLISYRSGTQNELDADQIEQCIETEKEILATMKRKGRDFNIVYEKIKQNGSQSVPSSQSGPRNMAKRKTRNLLSEEIYYDGTELDQASRPNKQCNPNGRLNYDNPSTARSEYQNAMEQLRRSSNSNRVSSKPDDHRSQRQQAALLNEYEVAPRDDWLVNDLINRDKKCKKRFKTNHLVSPNRKKLKAKNDGESRFRLKNSRQLNHRQSDDDTSEIFSDIEKSSDDDIDHGKSCVSRSNNKKSCTSITATSTAVHDRSMNCSIHQYQQSEIIRKDSSNSILPAVGKQTEENFSDTKLVIVEFDDLEKSSFAVPITRKELTFKWLSDELSKRYFRKYAINPVISLRTGEGAMLSEEDMVFDFIHVKQTFQAKIHSWITEPPPKLYAEFCLNQKIKPKPELLDVLRSLHMNGSFIINNAFFDSSKQVTALFQSLFRQEIKEINLSCTSIMNDRSSMQCFFDLLSTLPTLQVLNLSGAAFPREHLLKLLNLSPILRQLDLSFNSIGSECAYAITQIINMNEKLRSLNLSACDLSGSIFRNKQLISAIEGSNLTSIHLDYNDIEPDLVRKFKALNIDKSFLKQL